MKDFWQTLTIGELCDEGGGSVQTGPFGSQLHAEDYVADGVPFVMPTNLGENRIVENEIARISVADAERLSRYRLQKGDIIYGRRGDIGRRALVTEREDGWMCGSGCIRIRFGEAEVEPRFVSFYLGQTQVKELILAKAVGSTMPNLNSEIIRSIPISFPPLPIQSRIADILGALDDKIECNRRINQTPEAMADAFFKHWFLDSDNGWGSKPLDEVATFLNGLALQKYPPKGEASLPVIKIAELHRGVTESSDRASANIPSQYIVGDGDILFSWSGSLEVCVWCNGRGALNQHLFKVTSSDYPKWFYYQWVKYHLQEFRAIAAGKATTMGHIQREHLHQALAVIPPSETLQMMTNKMQPLLNQIISNSLESRTLTRTRDYLLPKLLSGEVEVKNLEPLLEATP